MSAWQSAEPIDLLPIQQSFILPHHQLPDTTSDEFQKPLVNLSNRELAAYQADPRNQQCSTSLFDSFSAVIGSVSRFHEWRSVPGKVT